MNAEKAAPLMRRGGDVIVFVSFNVLIFFFFHGLDSVVEGKNVDFRVVFSFFFQGA